MKTRLALATLALTALSACSNHAQTSMPKSFNFASMKSGIANGTVSPQESAEELALAAEQLAQSASFVYSARLSHEALAIDPTNVRAKFWSAVVAPTMELKGLMTRLEPLAKQNTLRYKRYLEAKKKMSDAATVKAVRTFLFAGPKDITSEEEVQDTISRVTLKMDELRKTLKDLKSEELVIYRNPEAGGTADQMRAAQESCTAQSVNGTVTLQGCDVSKAFEVRMNTADFEVASQMVAGYQVYVGLLNSYSAHGALNVAENDSLTGEQQEKALLGDSKFGQLRDGRTFAVIPELALDATLAARSALQIQQELCSQQGGQTWSRPGYAFANGSCELPDNGFDAALATIETLAKGQGSFTMIQNGVSKTTVVDLPKFSKAPLADLRGLLPTQTNKCGEATQINDGTVGGLFPNGDAAQVINPQDCP